MDEKQDQPVEEVPLNEETKEIPTGEKIPTEETLPKEEESPPPRPQRPLSPRSQARKTLNEAFPSIEDKYITMALIASQGVLDPAFNALLYLSDPSSEIDIPIPTVQRASQTQLESDEALARRLAKEYSKSSRKSQGTSSGERGEGRSYPRSGNYRAPPTNESEEEDMFERFMEKDLPEIKDQFNRNVEDAKTKISGWLGGFSQKNTEDGSSTQSQPLFSAFGQGGAGGAGGERASMESEKPSKFQRDDLNEQVSGIIISNNDEEDVAPPKPARRAEHRSWEPLDSVPPQPVANDTFQVTSDSDEENSVKK